MTHPLSGDLDHILEHTRELWEELRGERIFITGGTGFFGGWLLESFLWANERLNLNCRTTVLSRSPDVFRAKAPYLASHAAVSVIQGDIRTFAFPPGKYAYIIHAASGLDPNPNALTYFDFATLAMRHVMDFARSSGTRQVLFTSSGAVYGRQPPEIPQINEEYRGAPQPSETRLAYGHGKRAAEFLCTAYAELYNIEVKICRCFAFSGPYLPLDARFALGDFLKDALNGNPIQVKGDGTPYRSYLYAADLAIWLWTILVRGRNARAYNVGSENAVSIAQVAETVKRVVHPEGSVTITGRPDPGRSPERYVPSTQRARTELGLQEWIGLEEGIRRMAQWNLERWND